MKIWWCQEHESRGNPTLDAEWDKGEHLEMWAGCHDSLWSFASGMGDGGKEDKVGRCRMVPMRLIPDNAETVNREALVEALDTFTERVVVYGDVTPKARIIADAARLYLAALDGETP